MRQELHNLGQQRLAYPAQLRGNPGTLACEPITVAGQETAEAFNRAALLVLLQEIEDEVIDFTGIRI